MLDSLSCSTGKDGVVCREHASQPAPSPRKQAVKSRSRANSPPAEPGRVFVPPAPMIPISAAPAIDRGVIRSAANSRRRQSTPPRRPNPRHLAAVARATGGAETAPNFNIANDMSDSDATPMREGSLIALGSPITPPSAYRRADMLANSSASGSIALLQRSTELVTTGGPPIVFSPSPNSLSAQMEFRDQLAARAEHAMASSRDRGSPGSYAASSLHG